VSVVNVYYAREKKQLMGRLLMKNRQIFFEYDASFIKTGLELSPFKLPLQTNVISSNDSTFQGLFGVFNDSLPDGWGRLLLERQLMNKGLNPQTLSPLDRLCFVGSKGMGALTFEPENANTHLPLLNDLDEIANEIHATLNNNNTYVDDLLELGGSSAGARPKVLLNIDSQEWLIKFRSSLDPQDIGAIEYAYHQMAKDAGLLVPEATLFPSRKGGGFFGTKRFDRQGSTKIHMHSISGLIHADHRQLSLDYESIMQATLYLTKDVQQCEMQFRNAVFNVLTHNRDDHSKNFSFLMDEVGSWSVSPAYDLTFSAGVAGEHSTTVMGAGKNPTKEHLLKLASVGNIGSNKALQIINQVLDAVKNWPKFAHERGVSTLSSKNISAALNAIYKNL
jgi:serine/threonine-protein kinase HipA